MSSYDFEVCTKHFFIENVLHLPDNSSNVLADADITGSLDNAFVILASQYPCPLCNGPLVYYRFKECPSVAGLMRKGTASRKGQLDPRWNHDNHDKRTPAPTPPRIPAVPAHVSTNQLPTRAICMPTVLSLHRRCLSLTWPQWHHNLYHPCMLQGAMRLWFSHLLC